MKKIAFSCLFGLLFISAPLFADDETESSDKKTVQAIFESINQYRTSHGLDPLKTNDFIAKVAEEHSQEMASHKVAFGHDGFKTRIDKILHQFKHGRGAAENIAYTSYDPTSVTEMWLKSQGHRKNIEGMYNLTGIGLAHAEDGEVYVTQIFLRNVE